jgi:hypothetical protein
VLPTSLFEFVTVMISMILALTLGQLLSGAAFLLRSSREAAGSACSHRPYSSRRWP